MVETERAGTDDAALVDRLRDGDEAAFRTVVETFHPVLLRVARGYVPTDAIAEDVVQETWLGVLRGIDGFEGRSSLKTWLFRILVNRAMTRGTQERRTLPFASAFDPGRDQESPSVDPSRFEPCSHPLIPVHWGRPPVPWAGAPEERVTAAETRRALSEAMATLPPAQREVVTLRDVHGWSSSEVCNALSISETNQRVLLHRARTKLRQALDQVLTND